MFDLDDDMITPLDAQEQSVEQLLESLSLDIVRGNVEGQIRGEIAPNRDFLSVVLNKYDVIRENVTDNETVRLLQGELIDFSGALLDQICQHYNLFLNVAEEDSMETLEMLINLYTFFILNHEFYAREFLIGYITINKEQIITTLGLDAKGSDITSQAFRRQDIGAQEVAILANINHVIDFVADQSGVDVLEFLGVVDDGDYYITKMIEYYENGILGGNFVEDYLDEIVDERSSESALQIRNEIRVNLCGGQ